ncbi:MAG: ORF6N domain-containing protein [Bacteroidetes bacterium]|nr:ORF6N domain-containing protein [Bacteroidota bacterium]MBS1740162.1 ORF6N domain-containing protein [Bacteroidota bacterium]
MKDITANRSRIVTTSQKHRSRTALPYAFTEQGVAMLSGYSTLATKP